MQNSGMIWFKSSDGIRHLDQVKKQFGHILNNRLGTIPMESVFFCEDKPLFKVTTGINTMRGMRKKLLSKLSSRILFGMTKLKTSW